MHYENEIADLEQISRNENLNLISFKLDILNDLDRQKILNYDIDVFICNSAIGDSGAVADISIDKIKNVFNTNVFCNLNMIQLALEKMIPTGNGKIIIVSSLVRENTYALFISILCLKVCIRMFRNLFKTRNENIKKTI